MKNLLYTISVCLLIITINFKASSQTNTAYYMGSVPQSYYLNPATQPSCDLFIGIPAVSQIHARGITSGISASDIFFKDPLSDSVITPLHPNADVDEFLGKLDKTETIGMEAGLNLLSFGFRVKEMYFSFDASVRAATNATFSKEFIESALKGYEDDRTYNFSEGGYESLQYTSIAINVSRRFNENLQIGIRPKMLYGLATLNTLNNNTTLSTSVEEWVLRTNYQARFSAVGVTLPVDENGVYDPEGEIEFDSTIISPTGYQKIFSKNFGFGVDVGAHYMPIDRLQLSLSVLDLGYIKWRENTHIADVDGEYVFNGVHLTGPDSVNFGDNIVDSIKNDLNLTGSDQAFSTNLNPKLFVGGRYFLTPGFDVGVLYRADFYKSFIDHDVIFSANWHPHPMIALSGSYSVLNKTYSTFGLGLGFNLGPLNVYMILDDVPFKYDLANTGNLPVPIPVEQSDFNVRLGVNLVFGCNQKKKLKQDKPLFNSSDWIL